MSHSQSQLPRIGSLSISTYLSLLGLAITAPLLLFLGVLLFQSLSVQRAQLEGRVVQVLGALQNDVDRDLDRDVTILRTLATSQALANRDWITFYDQAKAGLQGRAYLVLIDSSGRQLVNTYVPYGQQPTLTGDPETLRRIVQTKEPVFSNLFTSLVVKKPVFNVSIPVLEEGQVRYVMSLGLLPDDLVALLHSQKLEPQWVTLMWDAKGAILARSRDNERFVGTPLPENMREHNERAAVRTTNLDGTDVLHATARSRVSGWGVGVNVPYSFIAAPMRNSLMVWGTFAVLAIAMALSLGTFLARQITKSLSAAAKAAAAFGRDESFPLTGSRLKEADAFLATLRTAREAREKLTEELKQSRAKLEAHASTLEERVRERTAELQGSNKELEAFSYSVSHDLRSPLRSMEGFSSVLLEEYAPLLDDRGKDYLRRVSGAADQMSVLIDKLLDLAQVKRRALSSQEVDLSALAHEIATSLRNQAPARQVDWEIMPGLVTKGDPALLRTALENLLGNAWKFTERHPRAKIEIGAKLNGESRVYFVRDDGAGFEMAHADKLFSPFERLHTKDEFPGTGVGLATVRRILERHGGEIWAESSVEHGATFFFTLKG